MSDVKYIKGVCIKEYRDEDDVDCFENGEILEEDIKVYKVGDEGMIVDGLYNKEYWKPKEE